MVKANSAVSYGATMHWCKTGSPLGSLSNNVRGRCRDSNPASVIECTVQDIVNSHCLPTIFGAPDTNWESLKPNLVNLCVITRT